MVLLRDADDQLFYFSLTTAACALGFNYCPTSAHRNIHIDPIASHVGVVIFIFKWNLVLRFDHIILHLQLPSVKIQFGFTLESRNCLKALFNVS